MNNAFLGSELGVGGGSVLWRGLGAVGGTGASGCGLEFRGQPNAVSGVGASGGDIDIATNNIDVLRSDNGGMLYTHTARVIPDTDYKAQNNELGNLVIDHRNLPNTTGGFYAYQAFVAPSNSSGMHNNEAFLGVSSDGATPGRTGRSRAAPSHQRPI